MRKLFNKYEKTIGKLWKKYYLTIYRKGNQNETNFLETL